MSQKRLDRKLAAIRAGDYTPADFIIADAKDGDMAFGMQTPGKADDGRWKPLSAYREDMVKVTRSDLVDIMLMSLSSAEALTNDGVFARSQVTPAVRLNDASDIWSARGGRYQAEPALPFSTARLSRVRPVADLGLYAITFYNDLARDAATLEAYNRFVIEAEGAGVRHFLEVFNPQTDVKTKDFWAFNNDAIARALAGMSHQDRPIFLKAAYNGPRATEEIASYDPENLIFGILGGGAGTTRDCLELIRQAETYGARVALFGRKIYYADDSVLMVQAMRRTLEERLSSEEGTKAYHDDLAKAGITPKRDLKDDLEVTETLLKDNM
ncbi:hypothetical protein EF888_12045 [Silicimonas algicola]|uniref:DhnA family fructose-bisphosphate aldolase class Ia n=1 Tax=Silicimonas algicola TaxID=1826607 RepID=A0A316GEI8_9RHOB|nr:hypothetical protein [Silicimonas algicola]AZQ67802.1 hypothetical protein EF888_12045 [Silicimonas algicola]PWK57780.1 hypothetical protein C8D95_102428 [Silicimonas algicola]